VHIFRLTSPEVRTGGGFEDEVVDGGGGLVLDDQGAGQGVDVLVEGDLGLPAGAGEPAQRRVGG